MNARGAKRGRASGRARRIAVITGTRAEYGLLVSPLRAIAADPRLELQLVVTGMHLVQACGHTVDQVRRDGWTIAARVPMQRGDDDPRDQAEGLARGIAGIARFLHAARSDIVVVLGDRIEALAGALAAVTTGRILAHVHGGDVAPGDFDDSLRHAITKLAHVHFPATPAAARRIVRLGEDPARVHVVGAVGLDRLRELLSGQGRGARSRAGGQVPAGRPARPDDVPFALAVYHATGRPAEREYATMRSLLRIVAAAGLHRRIVYPNTDRGHTGVVKAIEEHHAASPPGEVEIHRSLPRDDYLRALLDAAVLVGNSSSGIIEAPLAGTPSVDVGQRQAGREPGGPSIVRSDESPGAIRAALTKALKLPRRPWRATVYGDGRAGPRIAHILARLRLTDALRRKVIAY